MQVVHVPGDDNLYGPSVITIGAFDGVHRGHKTLLEELRRQATIYKCPSVVITFDRHPAEIVRPESAPKLLTTLEQKLELLGESGYIDICAIQRFDEETRNESAEDFVRSVLVGLFQAQLVIIGSDFHFGHQRRGNVTLLEEMGTSLGFQVEAFELVTDAAEVVSSTRIRKLIAAGDVATAAVLLERPYELRGTVVRGDGRGRTIGFPTANLDIGERQLLPSDGIYAGIAICADGVTRPTAISVGKRPTFHSDATQSLVEAHLLDFDADIYDQELRVQFQQWLRGEEKFDSVEDLVSQIKRDVASTRKIVRN